MVELGVVASSGCGPVKNMDASVGANLQYLEVAINEIPNLLKTMPTYETCYLSSQMKWAIGCEVHGSASDSHTSWTLQCQHSW